MRIPPVLAGAAVLALSVASLPLSGVSAQHAAHDPIAAAIAAPTRTPANIARDRYRHPAETLAFFGVKPGQTVVEYSPAGGWYTEILAPLLKDKGTFYAAQAPGKGFDALKAKLDADRTTYGKVKLVAWPNTSGAIPVGSVDTVLTFRNVHNMVMNGTADATFKAFADLLKPGGTLGIVDHRLPEDRDVSQEKTSGYLKVSTIKALAAKAGLTFAGASEINANPKDTADWENGVWTLPPVLRNGETDKAKYIAIGESDRMTLKFVKPK